MTALSHLHHSTTPCRAHAGAGVRPSTPIAGSDGRRDSADATTARRGQALTGETRTVETTGAGATNPRQTLIVEDQPALAFGLRVAFESHGYEVLIAADPASAVAAMPLADWDLVLLDLDLPDLGGYDVLRALQERPAVARPPTPVLVVSSRSAEADKVRALHEGASDYVTKPFGVAELLARAAALGRRTRGANAAARERYAFGAVKVDVAARAVTRAGHEVTLPPRAFDLLVALLRRDGAVAGRDELLRDVWGRIAGVSTRTVDMHISILRRAIEHAPSRPRHIRTIFKLGYRLDP